MTQTCPDCKATVLSTSQPTVTVTDDMVETAWAAIVGGDIAKTCFNASIIRADLKTGLVAALAAKKPTWEQIQLLYHQEFESISDHISALDAQIFVLSQPAACIFNDAIEQAALTALAWRADPTVAVAIRELKVNSPALRGSEEALDAAIHLINLLRPSNRDPVALRFAEQDFETALEKLRTQPASPLRGITDEMVNLACEIYAEVYHDDDKDMGDAMRAALKAALYSAPPEQLAKLLNDIIDASQDFRRGMPADWEGDPLQDAIDEARAFVGMRS